MIVPPAVPDLLKPPDGERLVMVLRASGFQIYVCQADDNGSPAWTLKAPEAELKDEQGTVVGRHYGGPTWEHTDGSKVRAKLLARTNAPEPGNIPWLLLRVSERSGQGVFSQVSSIQRLNTVSGLPPDACAEADLGTEVKSDYQADYFFYAPE